MKKNRGAFASRLRCPIPRLFAAALLVIAPAVRSAFAQGPPPGPPGAVAQSAEVTLSPLPEVRLDDLSPEVAEQLRSGRALLEQSLKTPGIGAADLAESYGLLGQLYQAYGLNDAARACYRNALALAPASFNWNYYLAVLLSDVGELDEAVEFYTRALTEKPDDLAATLRLGNALLQRGELAEARARFLRAMILDRNSAAASFGLGQVALSNREYADAVGLFHKTLALVPGADAVHYPLALAYRGLGLREQAEQHLTRRGQVGVAVADPLMDKLQSLKQGEVVNLLRGRAAYAARRFTEAAQLFLKAAAADPQSARARINASAALAAMRDFDAAEKQLREALAIEPDNATANFNLGVLLLSGGRAQEARPLLEKTLELDPRDDRARSELGKAMFRLGDAERAMTEFREALRINKGNEEARLDLAQLLMSQRRYGEVRDLLVEANREFPGDGRTAHALARILAAGPDPDLRDGKAALPLALKVFEARNSVGHARTVAMAYAETGQCGKAAEWLGQILDTVAGAEGLAEDLENDLQAELLRYRQGPPCRPPAEAPATQGAKPPN